MQRFYYPAPIIEDGVVDIHDLRIVNQCTKVLRMKPGSRFSVFDENGVEWLVELLEINRRQLLANVIETINRQSESPLTVNLYQAIPKKTALFELVIQKATEIGVSQIFPLVTRRTEKHRLSKFERMQNIAIEAAEQCGRTAVPTIRHPVSLDDVASQLEHGYVGFEYEEKNHLRNFLPEIQKNKTTNILIGPEGGFDQKEIDQLVGAGIKPFGLGPRILRTETAAISALSLVLL